MSGNRQRSAAVSCTKDICTLLVVAGIKGT